MANEKHLELLRQGVDTWNAWRLNEPNVEPDLTRASLSKANLRDAFLKGARLCEADLREASLWQADLRGADLSEAMLSEANLTLSMLCGANLTRASLYNAQLPYADLSQANLVEACFSMANLSFARLRDSNLSDADLTEAVLHKAYLEGSNLRGANLDRADLGEARLQGADLTGAKLSRVIMIGTYLQGANLTGCHVFGISAWGLKLSDDTKQKNLILTSEEELEITTDDIELAQFLYLMLHNEKVRSVIDTITSKVVLILGRFAPERKLILDALRDELRNRGYVPVVFDFDKPGNQTIGETVALLARMARFVIADLTDAKSVLQELRDIVPNNPSLAVQPLVLVAEDEPGMFDFFKKFPWVLKTYRYNDLPNLTSNLDYAVVRPVEAKVLELRGLANI